MRPAFETEMLLIIYNAKKFLFLLTSPWNSVLSCIAVQLTRNTDLGCLGGLDSLPTEMSDKNDISTSSPAGNILPTTVLMLNYLRRDKDREYLYQHEHTHRNFQVFSE